MKYQFSERFSFEKCNAASFISALNFPKLCESKFVQSNLRFYPDGNLMQLLIFLKTGRLIKKVNFDFSGIASDFFSYCSTLPEGQKIFFCGGSKTDNFEYIDFIKASYPNLTDRIYGMDGFVEEKRIIDEAINCDIVVLGLGSPKQEIIAEQILLINNKVKVYTCGAFITQTADSGSGRFYPLLVRIFNVRWLYRALKEAGHYKRLVYALKNAYRSWKVIDSVIQ
jgi:UDP-N-acetyl-D-mannosaminuronic acid transferase (WecB/TagA/CpsF family)